VSIVLFLALLAVVVVLFATQVVRIEVTAIGTIVVLALSGVLEPQQALSGFSSPATVTVAAMLVLSAGLERAGVVDYGARLLAELSIGGVRRLLAMLALPTVAFSAFVNNTPVVVLMIPVTLTLARRASIAPSRVLLPVSYLSILGGTCTLFGTSTNVLVDALHREAGGAGLGVFDFAPLGIVYVVLGLAYVLIAAPSLLPERQGFSELLAVQAPGRFVAEVVVRAGGRYRGKEIRQAFPPSRDVTVLQVVRDEESMIKPGADVVLREGDVLYVESTARALHHLFADPELERGTAVADDERVPLHSVLAGPVEGGNDLWNAAVAEPAPDRVGRVDLHLAEAVVTPTSRFVGRKVRAIGLSRRHGVQVLAIRRMGRQHQYRIRDASLQPGDVLLVQGEPSALRAVHEEGDFLLVEGVERTLTFPERAPVAVAILMGVVLFAAFGVAPLVLLALAGVALMLAMRCIDVREAVRAVDPQVFFLLAGTIPLGLAMQELGVARDAAGWIVESLGGHAHWVLIGALYVLTNLLTEVLSNNATAVLLTPIVLGISDQMGIDAKPLLMAIAFGASASFSTPIGYQTNALVMGPGGYRFSDYLRFGLPLNLLMAATAAALIPWIWPL